MLQSHPTLASVRQTNNKDFGQFLPRQKQGLYACSKRSFIYPKVKWTLRTPRCARWSFTSTRAVSQVCFANKVTAILGRQCRISFPSCSDNGSIPKMLSTLFNVINDPIRSALASLQVTPASYAFLFPPEINFSQIEVMVGKGVFPTVEGLAPALTYFLILNLTRYLHTVVLFQVLSPGLWQQIGRTPWQ